MKKSLMIYESYYGTSKRVSEIFAKIVGNSKVISIENRVKDIDIYDNIFLVFSFHGYDTARETKEYLKEIHKDIEDKRIVLIGVGLYKKDMENYSKSLENILGEKVVYKEFVEGELRVNKLTVEDRETLEKFLAKQNMKLMDMGKFKLKECCDLAAKYRQIINKPEKIADNKIIYDSITSFLEKHNTCALATSNGEQVRVTPIEYIYYDNKIYFITEGGLKFNGILQNPHVAVAVYEEYTGMNNLRGLQITGKGEVVDVDSDEYKTVLSIKKLNYDNIKNFPINMNMIKVNIERYDFLNSDFKSLGYDASQRLEK